MCTALDRVCRQLDMISRRGRDQNLGRPELALPGVAPTAMGFRLTSGLAATLRLAASMHKPRFYERRRKRASAESSLSLGGDHRSWPRPLRVKP